VPETTVNCFHITIDEEGLEELFSDINGRTTPLPKLEFSTATAPCEDETEDYEKEPLWFVLLRLLSPLTWFSLLFFRKGGGEVFLAEYFDSEYRIELYPENYAEEVFTDEDTLRQNLIFTIAHELGHAISVRKTYWSWRSLLHNAVDNLICSRSGEVTRFVLAWGIAGVPLLLTYEGLAGIGVFAILKIFYAALLAGTGLYCITDNTLVSAREALTDSIAETLIQNYGDEFESTVRVKDLLPELMSENPFLF